VVNGRMSEAMSGRLGEYSATPMIDAERLLARARGGDDEAFRLIFERHHRVIMRFLYGMVGRHALAEELTQETFMAAYKNIGTLRDDSKLSTWLYGIARNVARKSFHARRGEQRQTGLEDAQAAEARDAGRTPDEQVLGKELNRVIADALGRLDEDKRLVFTLKVLQQFSYEEIAEMSGHSVPKLKTDLHRARLEMRRMLRPYMEASDEV
jgi:RNA polymerase sigma-70 factor (ECF subfamily)